MTSSHVAFSTDKLRFHRIRLDGRPKRKQKQKRFAFSNENGYMWTGKNDLETIRVDGEIFDNRRVFFFAFFGMGLSLTVRKKSPPAIFEKIVPRRRLVTFWNC